MGWDYILVAIFVVVFAASFVVKAEDFDKACDFEPLEHRPLSNRGIEKGPA